jgi:hypothetical protein
LLKFYLHTNRPMSRHDASIAVSTRSLHQTFLLSPATDMLSTVSTVSGARGAYSPRGVSAPTEAIEPPAAIPAAKRILADEMVQTVEEAAPS